MKHPKISTYECKSGPMGHAWLARFFAPTHDRSGKLHDGFLPILFNGATQDEVEQSAKDWWDTEQKKEADRASRSERQSARMRKSA